MKITGLEELQKSMRELQNAVSELDGNIASVNFDPHDPQSIELAIQSAHAAIDDKVARYGRNEFVAGLASDLKANVRTEILERASAARLDDGEQG
jgi:hypothetical protein